MLCVVSFRIIVNKRNNINEEIEMSCTCVIILQLQSIEESRNTCSATMAESKPLNATHKTHTYANIIILMDIDSI